MSDQAASMKPGDKVWVSKFALSAGVTLEEVSSRWTDGYVAVPGYPDVVLRIGRDCHATRAAAIADAEKRRTDKIASLHKQIAKLEALTFAVEATS